MSDQLALWSDEPDVTWFVPIDQYGRDLPPIAPIAVVGTDWKPVLVSCTPVRVTRSSASRSSAAKVTGYFFRDGGTTSCLAEGKEDLPDPRLHHQSKN